MTFQGVSPDELTRRTVDPVSGERVRQLLREQRRTKVVLYAAPVTRFKFDWSHSGARPHR